MLKDVTLVLKISVKRSMTDAETLGDMRYSGLMLAALRKLHEGSINDVLPQLQALPLCPIRRRDH